MSLPAYVVVLSAGCALPACGEPELTCATVDLTCAPLYAPTFENVYANTLAMKCGDDRSACHSEAGRAGGLSLADAATAYAELTDPAAGRIVAGDVSCGHLIARLYTDEAELVMPSGAALGDSERCAIAQWIAAGAPGPAAAGSARRSALRSAP